MGSPLAEDACLRYPAAIIWPLGSSHCYQMNSMDGRTCNQVSDVTYIFLAQQETQVAWAAVIQELTA